MPPKKQIQTQGKRAREGSSNSDQDEDIIFLEMLERISALESKDKENTKKLEDMQFGLDQANAEISLLREQIKSLEESLKFTQAEHKEVKERVNTCEEDQMRNEDDLIRQNIYSRRWNLIIYGIEESAERENCTTQVKNVMLSALKINEEIVNTMKFCGVHRLGKSKQSSGRPRPVIARFTCREDRDLVWRQRYNLKGSCFSLAEDLPPAVRKIRKTILVPAMKEARKIAGTKATITGDRLIVNGKRYTFDQIPKKWNGNDES